MNRRELLKRASMAAVASQATGLSRSARAAANDRIAVGLIGCGHQGTWDLRSFMEQPDVEVVALCDVYGSNLQRTLQLAGGKARTYHEHRRLLEDKEVQAVVIATPEHWHALMCIDACDAGKDVYVEKPASHYIRDGRLMVEAARRNNRVVQVGSQQRSGSHFQRAVKYVQEGRIGEVYYVTCWNHAAPAAPGAVAQAAVSNTPPADLDYDLWLGPAPKLPFARVWDQGRRTSWDFFGGMLTEWGAHLVDIALWGMKATAPKSVVAVGGQYCSREGEIPDTQQVLYDFGTFLLQYSVLHHNSFGPNGDPGANRHGTYGIQFHGSKGTLFVDRAGFRLSPQYIRHDDPNHPPRPVTWSPDERQLGYYYSAETLPEYADSSMQHQAHARNFVDCVKSRHRPNADIEDGHHANSTCRLGNIAYRLGRKIHWDGAREQVVDDVEANRLVAGTYRSPWIPKGL